jgi:hypothetical protein
MSLYWLCYRVNDTFNGLVLLEAETELHARMRAGLEDLSPGGDCQSYQIGSAEAAIIPSKLSESYCVGMRSPNWKRLS